MPHTEWKADPAAELRRRWGGPPESSGDGSCPDIWELDNGDVAVIGQDLTENYRSRLPQGVSIDPGESMVIVPRSAVLAAKADIPDA